MKILLISTIALTLVSSTVFADPGKAINDGKLANELAFEKFKEWAAEVKLQGNLAAHWQQYVEKGSFTGVAAAYGNNGLVYMPTVFKKTNWNEELTKGLLDPKEAPMDQAVRDFKEIQKLKIKERQTANRLASNAAFLSNYQKSMVQTFDQYLNAGGDNLLGAAAKGAKKEVMSALQDLAVRAAIRQAANGVVTIQVDKDALPGVIANFSKENKQKTIDSFSKAATKVSKGLLGVARVTRDAAWKGALEGVNAVTEKRSRLAFRMQTMAKHVETIKQLIEQHEKDLAELVEAREALEKPGAIGNSKPPAL